MHGRGTWSTLQPCLPGADWCLRSGWGGVFGPRANSEASYTFDGSRNVGANMGWIAPVKPRTLMSDALDVMGMSHASSQNLETFHAVEPDKPLVMTECCSCENQRGEDADQHHNSTLVHYDSEVAGCLWEQTQRSDSLEYVGGTFVWTLHDYMGEPGRWPHVRQPRHHP